MTLLALLLVGGVGAAATAWALPRGGTTARTAALGGVIGLALIGILAAASPTPGSIAIDAGGAVPGTLWNGGLVANGYLRLVVVLAATTSLGMCGITWLLRGVPALRGLLPASLAALVGTTVALGASTPQLALVAAGATGLASIPVLLATPRAVAAGVAAREVRIAVATAVVVLAVASVLPTLSRLVAASSAGDGDQAGSGVAAAVAFGLLAITLIVAARVGALPYHVRVSALTDSAAEGSLPLVLAWLPLPLAAVSVGVVLSDLAPLGLPVGSAQALIVVLALLATMAGGLVAAFQDDLRHAVGYLTLADIGLVLLAFAALDPAAWGPARTWLLSAAVTKSALAAWAVVAEDRFETRSVPDLRGWLRPSPLLGLALVLIVLATYGLPGWAVLTARLDLTRLAAGSPWDLLLLAASLLTLPAYARWLWLGLGAATSHVDGATPEFLAQRAASGRAGRFLRPPTPRRGRGRDEGLPVEQETDGSYSFSTVATDGPRAPRVRPTAPMGRPAATPVPVPASPRRASAAVVAPSVGRHATAAPTAGQKAQTRVPPDPAPQLAPDPVAPGGAHLDTPLEPSGSRLRIGAILSRRPKASSETSLWGGSDQLELPAPAQPVAKPARATRAAWVPEPEPPAPTRAPAKPTPRATPAWGRPEAEPPAPAEPAPGPVHTAAPTLFDLPDPDPAINPQRTTPTPTPPELGSVRPGTGVGRRTRPPADKPGSSPMTAPRAPEASKALPAAMLAAEAELDASDASPEPVARSRRGRAPSGPDAATRVSAAVRRHRTDLLSAAVLALALLATVVAAGAFDVSKAACQPTQAVPTVSTICN